VWPGRTCSSVCRRNQHRMWAGGAATISTSKSRPPRPQDPRTPVDQVPGLNQAPRQSMAPTPKSKINETSTPSTPETGPVVTCGPSGRHASAACRLASCRARTAGLYSYASALGHSARFTSSCSSRSTGFGRHCGIDPRIQVDLHDDPAPYLDHDAYPLRELASCDRERLALRLKRFRAVPAWTCGTCDYWRPAPIDRGWRPNSSGGKQAHAIEKNQTPGRS
jgi:hypothetical protein